jgi:hypothetical protein
MGNVNFNYQYPYLYRYEDDIYIDQFFDTGKILISAFHVYKSYDDNQLGDPEEGRTKDFQAAVDSNLMKSFVIGHSEAGNNAYCFCTSTILDPKLFRVFKRNSVFRITDLAGFGTEIYKSIKEATQEILFGNCDYLYERILRGRLGMIGLHFEPTENNIKGSDFFSMSLFGNKLLFVKLIKYQSQCEYRILWQIEKDVNSSVILDCPEATKFCEKISNEEMEEVLRQLA